MKISPDQWEKICHEIDSGQITQSQASIKYHISKGLVSRRMSRPRITLIPVRNSMGVDLSTLNRIEICENDYRTSVANYLRDVMEAKSETLIRLRDMVRTEKDILMLIRALEVLERATQPITLALIDELTRKDSQDNDLEQLTNALKKKGYGQKVGSDPS